MSPNPEARARLEEIKIRYPHFFDNKTSLSIHEMHTRWLIKSLETAWNKPVLTIGDYKITQYRNGSIWISHESGEGGEMSLESFEKMYKEWL